MSKVCYIHPSGSSEFPSHWVMPAGIFAILDKIQKSEFEVIALNYPMEWFLDRNFNIEKWIFNNQCKYYLVGMHWYVHLRNALQIIELIKKLLPDSIIIVGGITASLCYKSIFTECKNIDYLIKGDGEEAILQLISFLENGKDVSNIPNICFLKENKLYWNENQYQMMCFDGLSYSNIQYLLHYKVYPFFSYRRMMKKERSFWLVNGRGCLCNCIGCDGAKNGKYSKENHIAKNFVVRNIEDVCRDIEQLTELKLNYIKLTHDICFFGESYCALFFSKLKNEDIKIYNECWQLPNDKFYEIIEYHHFNNRIVLAITIHSGDEHLRARYGKCYTNEELIKNIEMCLKLNIRIQLFFSRFLDGETPYTLSQTFSLINEIIIKDKKNLIKIIYEPLIADPFSKMQTYKEDINLTTLIEYSEKIIIDGYDTEQLEMNILDKKIIRELAEKNYD